MDQHVRRMLWLALIIFAPLIYLILFQAAIPQDPGYHILADKRTCLGIRNFGDVITNVAFLLAGGAGWLWCYRHLNTGARLSWLIFFAGVTLVFFGSAYYHTTPNNNTLVWDRLPMTFAFMGLFAALLSEHLGARWERPLLIPALVIGVASVFYWRYTNDLRLYVWVQGAPLLAIPFVLAMFRARFTHRWYLLFGLGFYALAKVAEINDWPIFEATGQFVSGHSIKHLLAACAPLMLWLMLRRRRAVAEPAR
ncbi:MAG: hypothetical protein FJY56_09725 [Betaproteobacteria bacterium]|nr:hypothetical protein [Betaproteobacteria bacterium]